MATSIHFLTRTRKLLREGGALSEFWSTEINDVDGDNKKARNAEEDGEGVGKMFVATDICTRC